MRFYKIIDGEMWKWEYCKIGEDKFIRMIKILDLVVNKKSETEDIIEEIINTPTRIVYNLK